LPVEGGEERQEKAENAREEDRGEDDIERCLKEYEETMNNPKTDSGEVTGAFETEELKTNAGEWSQSTNEETQLSHGSENNLHQEEKRGRGEEQGREDVGESSQTLEQQYSNAESLQHSEVSPTEQQHFNKTNKHEEGETMNVANIHDEVDVFSDRERDNIPEVMMMRENNNSTSSIGERVETTADYPTSNRGERQRTQSSQESSLGELGGETPRGLSNELTTSQNVEDRETTLLRTNAERLKLNQAMGEQVTETGELKKATIYDATVIGAGELAREWRTDLGLNQCELADKLGYCRQSISYWENNKIPIPLENLQQLSHIAGKDLEQSLRELQFSGNQNVAVEWKGAIYNVDALVESIRDCCATLKYSETSRLYYLELNPMANVEFHRGDIMITLLEKDGVQSVAELAPTGVRALIKKTVVERMGIEPGDRLSIKVLSVSGPEDPPWKQSIPVTLTMINDENRIQLSEKLEKQGFKVREGDYLKMIIQTDRGEGLVMGRIKDGAVTLSKCIKDELLGKGGEEVSSLRVKMGSVVLSPRLLREEEELTVRVRGAVHVGGLLSREGFTFTPLKEREILKATVITERGSREGEGNRRLSMRIWGISRDVYPPYSTTEEGTKLILRTDDIVVLKREKGEALRDQDRRTSHDGTFYTTEKSIIGRDLFDAFTKHMYAETLYQVENPNQHGIDRIIERNGRIVLVEEKAEYEYGLEWRSTTTVNQITGYKNRFRELIESSTELMDRLQGREPDALEIWTTAKIPRDQNGEIDLSEIRLYDQHFRRTLQEGETATFRVPQAELNGKVQYCLCHSVPHKVSVSENDIIFSLPRKSTRLDNGREVTLLCEESSEWLEIRVKHYDHVKSACENAQLFDDGTRKDLNEKLNRIGRRC